MIIIRTATSDIERQKVYALRYEHLYKEGADPQYANHETLQYIDDYDTANAILIVAEDISNGEIVGTLRLILKNQSLLPYDWCYDYKHLSAITNLPITELQEKCALFDRIVVKRSHRRMGISWMLVHFAENMAINNGASILLETWTEANYSLALSYVRKANWILSEKGYYNSKGKRYYFGYKLLSF